GQGIEELADRSRAEVIRQRVAMMLGIKILLTVVGVTVDEIAELGWGVGLGWLIHHGHDPEEATFLVDNLDLQKTSADAANEQQSSDAQGEAHRPADERVGNRGWKTH